jgi:hypothetical protein
LFASSPPNTPKLRNPKTLDAGRVSNAVTRVAIRHVDLLMDGHLRDKIASSGIGILPQRINAAVANG